MNCATCIVDWTSRTEVTSSWKWLHMWAIHTKNKKFLPRWKLPLTFNCYITCMNMLPRLIEALNFFNFLFLDTKFAYLMSENGQRNVQLPIIKLSMYVPVPNVWLHQWSYQLWCCKNSRVGKTGALTSKTCWFSCMSHHGTFAKRSKITWLDLSYD